jgi:tetratricopeptide (TPR) repeat protein
MLREMADALELFSRGRALVLVLEDLQWSDPSTADLIACLARRRHPARLLVIGSMRLPELTVHSNPLRAVKEELQANGLCGEVALELLSGAEVAAYMAARFGGDPSDALRRLATRIYERTEGNALFMVNVANDLVARQLLVHRDGQWQVAGSIDAATDEIPRQLQDLIVSRLRALDPAAREVLEAASVAGDEFAVAAVAAALEDEGDKTEDICEALASQRSLIADAGVAEWPDGSATGRYRFVHALYRRVLYECIGEARRIRLHRAIGLREEVGFGARAGERVAQLAMHFTRGHDHARARAYHELAGAAALDRHAAHEAVAHYCAALEALAREPESLERTRHELAVVVAIATLRMATNGYAAAATERAFSRARALCDAMPTSPQLYPVLRGLVSYHHVRAELAGAHELGELLLRHAAARPDEQALRVQAHYGHGATLFHLGALDAARAHLELALREYDPTAHREHVVVYGGYDPGVACSLWLAWTLVLQGELREAIRHHRDGLVLARRLGDSFSLAWASYGAGVLRQLLGDWAESEAPIAEAMRLADEGGFPHVLGMATIHRGWGLMMQGKIEPGIPMLREGVALVEATGAALVRPSYLAMLAAADAIEGNRGLAVERVDAGLAEIERTGERVHEATLLVGKSHLLVGSGPLSRAAADSAESCLRRALGIAHSQGARLLELRAAVALARHCHKQGRAAEVRETLAGAHAWFASARSTVPEIRAARDLLAAIAA